MSTNSRHTNWKFIILNLLFWLMVTIIVATLYFLSVGDKYEGGWLNFFYRQLPIWMYWGIASIPIFYLIRSFKQRHFSFWKHVSMHFLMFGVLFFCFYVFYMSFSLFLSDEPLSWKAIFQSSGPQLVLNFILNLLIYLLISAFIYSWFWNADLRQSELEKTQIKSQLQEAQLNMLNAQIQPHFLFNALNSISGLMRKQESEKAIQAIADLGQLLRSSLEFESTQFIPLKQELEFVNQYLKMEQLRFGDQLKIKTTVDEILENVFIPALILQPLVENAIKYGIYKTNESSILEINVNKEGEHILISIENDIPEPSENLNFENKKGLGIDNVRRRLSSIYADRNFNFEVKAISTNQVRAFLKLPI